MLLILLVVLALVVLLMLKARFPFSVTAALMADRDSTRSIDIVPSDKPCSIWLTTGPRCPPSGGPTT